jgi:RNA polymerase primary sigma factor
LSRSSAGPWHCRTARSEGSRRSGPPGASTLQAHGAEPTNQDLSRTTGFTPTQLERLQATERTPRSLQERWSADEGTTATVGDMIADPVAEQAYEHVLDTIEVREVRDLADQLDERERAVLRAHYGLGEPAQTLTQIGTALGLTGERARQIEVGALNKLREALAQPATRWEGPA